MSGSISILLFLLAVIGCATAGWEKLGKGYYSVHTETRGWEDAWLACAVEGGQLVIFNTPQDVEAVKPLLSRIWPDGEHTNDYTFVGVNALFKKTHYITNLESMAGSISTLLLLLAVIGCASAAWEKLATGSYNVHLEKLSWHAAWLTCTIEGGHLVVVNSPEEGDVIKTLLESLPNAPKGNTYAFVGVHALFHKPHFVTVFGKPLSYTNFQWAPGQPDDSGGQEQCAVVIKSGLLHDMSCNRTQPFICEKTSLAGLE